MESVGRKSRPRRSFTPEFKAEIVELCQRGVRSVGQVARDFDLTETAVREWVKQAERDAGTRDDGGLTSDEQAAGAAAQGEPEGGRAAKRWKKTTIPDSGAAARADRIRPGLSADASKLNTRWCADITYIATWEGWLLPRHGDRHRLTADRRLRPRGPSADGADQRRAIQRGRRTEPGAGRNLPLRPRLKLVHLSCVRRPRRRLPRWSSSTGRTSQCWDNALAESFFSSLKGELIDEQSLAHPGRVKESGGRVHRLVQRHPPALLTRLPRPRPTTKTTITKMTSE